MNAFDKFDADRALRRKNRIPAWTQFRAAVVDCLNSYEKMEEGQAYPTESLENQDKSLITVTCKRPSSAAHDMVSVKLQMTFANHKLAILAFIETWLLVNDRPSNQSTNNYEFLIEPDETLRLSFDGKHITPGDAAEMVLMKALLGIPVERDGIAVVGKRSIA